MAVTSAGEQILVGYSEKSWDGPGSETPLHPFQGGGRDITIVKMDANGAYQWHTFFGSSIVSSDPRLDVARGSCR
jgi:hypothetical protein